MIIPVINEGLIDLKSTHKTFEKDLSKEQIKVALEDLKKNKSLYMRDINYTLKLTNELENKLNVIVDESTQIDLWDLIASSFTSKNPKEIQVSSYLTQNEWNDLKSFFNVWVKNVHSYREAVSNFLIDFSNGLKSVLAEIAESTDVVGDWVGHTFSNGDIGIKEVDVAIKGVQIAAAMPRLISDIMPELKKTISSLTLTIEKLKYSIDKKENINDVFRFALEGYQTLYNYSWYKTISVSYWTLRGNLWKLSEKAKELYSKAEQRKQETEYQRYFSSGY
ncbi:hypothetical protein [Mycoplasmopsis gallinacea]|uniref:Uncharacterized protein n=1 Tax=Mycoplasmopsis gallinacea TaxID=29556 RepID=A0A6H0V0W5_9BACT|nr:hypothetical protein [Mycoplasmopsis gallinacea]QIW61981.1 hypothetical protein GOQ20_00640 [Mycoplasmopsis gallinacea]